MAILKSKSSGTTYDTETGIRTNADGTTTKVNNITNESPVISSETLTTNPNPVTLPENLPTADTTAISSDIGASVTNAKNLSQAETDKQALLEKNKAETSTISKLMTDIGTEEKQKTFEAQTETGAYEAKKAYDEYVSQIEAEDLALRRQKENLRASFAGSTAGLQDILGSVERKSLSKQADLAILQNASVRRYETAMQIAKDKVEMEMAPKKAELESLKYIYENNKAFQTAEFTSLLNRKENEIASEKDEKTKANEMYINAIQGKAPQSILTKAKEAIDSGKSSSEVASILGNYSMSQSDKLDLAIKNAQLKNLTATSAEAPTTKTINGVDMQWDSTTGKWVTPTTDEVVDSTKIQNSLDNLTFLEETANKATKLAGASGVSGIKKFAGDLLVGDTKYRQLESLTNTLKTNVLSLMTDPSIKKFFGPQMSNADVELMTSAGTTLNPEKQSPEMLKSEITRLTSLFTRMKNTIQDNATSNYLDTVDNALQVTNGAYSAYNL